jgi:hypothetical protein
MSITTARQLRNFYSQKDAAKTNLCQDIDVEPDFVRQLTVSTMVKTMLEIIKIKKSHIMDKETREQFPMIAKEIILLAEQTQ